MEERYGEEGENCTELLPQRDNTEREVKIEGGMGISGEQDEGEKKVKGGQAEVLKKIKGYEGCRNGERRK